MPFNVGGYIYNNETGYTLDYRGPSTIPVRGLVCYLDSFVLESYPGSGSSWYDLSGNDYTWTIQGNVSWTSTGGFTNFGGNSTGSGNKIYISSSNICKKLKTGQGGVGLTILMWAYSDSGNGGPWRKLIGNSDGENFIDLYQSAASPYGWHADGSGETLYANGVGVADNVSVMTGTGWKLWGATNSNGGLTTQPTYDLAIGNEPNSTPYPTNAYPWGGGVATFMLYNRILTTTEMIQIYNIQKGRFGL